MLLGPLLFFLLPPYEISDIITNLKLKNSTFYDNIDQKIVIKNVLFISKIMCGNQ